MHRTRKASVALALALGLAALVPVSASAALGDGLIGGVHDPTGFAAATNCPAGGIVTGVAGGTRDIGGGNQGVGVATVQCETPTGTVPGTATMGQPNGTDTPGSTACPVGQVAVGITGNEGDRADALLLRCRASDLTGPITLSSPLFGGPGGVADGPYDCPAGRALTGLQGEVLDDPSFDIAQYFSVVCAAAAVTPPVIPPVIVPKPILGVKMNVVKVKGQVLIALPLGVTGAGRARSAQKGLTFVPLESVRQIPIGSFLDTRRGTVRLTTARDAAGTAQTGNFSAGLFQVLQSRKLSAKGLTDLVLKGSSFRNCRARSSSTAQAAARRYKKRTVRRLRSNARGRFRTRGRYSAATVRGTVWNTTDRCDGTLTKVTRGKVIVRDFRRRRNVVVRAGKRTRGGGRGSYLARPR